VLVPGLPSVVQAVLKNLAKELARAVEKLIPLVVVLVPGQVVGRLALQELAQARPKSQGWALQVVAFELVVQVVDSLVGERLDLVEARVWPFLVMLFIIVGDCIVVLKLCE
jgi:hypothetical protein